MDEDITKKDKELMKQVKRFVIKNFGNRCPKYCVDCPTCEAWNSFDRLFNITTVQEKIWEKHLKSKSK